MVRGIDAPQFRVGLALCLEFILSWYVTFPNLFWDNKLGFFFFFFFEKRNKLAYDKRVKPVLHDQWSPDTKVMKLISDSYSKNIF